MKPQPNRFGRVCSPLRKYFLPLLCRTRSILQYSLILLHKGSVSRVGSHGVSHGILSRMSSPWMSIISTIITAVVVVVVDSHIQRFVLATEETAVTQQVSHRPIKCQSRLWSRRGTKVNGSHHGDNPLLRPTGIQIATRSYATPQAMTPTHIQTVHQPPYSISRAALIDSDYFRLPTTSVLSNKADKLRSNQF